MGRIMLPDERRLYDADDGILLAQAGNDSGNAGPQYIDPLKSMGGGRLSNIAKIFYYGLLQKVTGAMRDSVKGEGIIPDTLRAFFGGFNEKALLEYHRNGIEAFKMPRLGGLNKIFQNLWSLAYASKGVTTIERFYTVRVGGEEYLIHIARKGEGRPPEKYLKEIVKTHAKELPQISDAVFQSVVSGKYENRRARIAGVYAELTDYDVKDLVENPEKVVPYFQASELFAIGNGRRRVVGKFNGIEIVEYSRDDGKVLAHHAKTDFLYSIYGLLLGGLEKAFKGVQKIYVYDREVRRSIKYAIDIRRPDGYENPIAKYLLRYL